MRRVEHVMGRGNRWGASKISEEVIDLSKFRGKGIRHIGKRELASENLRMRELATNNLGKRE